MKRLGLFLSIGLLTAGWLVPDLHAQINLAYQSFRLRHVYSQKYLCSGGRNNGDAFWMWGPVPGGHETRYTFHLMPAPGGGNLYYLQHVYSGKFLCSDKTQNGGNFWMWGPIPQGHESRYAFRFIHRYGPVYYLQHVYSGKFLCSGQNQNGGNFWMWGPIPQGHEDRYSFRLE